MNRAVALALLLGSVGCAAARPRPASLAALDRASAGPVARQVQRDAPAAYAEFAAAMRAAETEPARVAVELRVREAELVLAWAETQAQGNRARARAHDADQRRREAMTETARMEQEAAAINAETAQRVAAREAQARARVAAGPTAAVPPTERAATAEDLREQAAITLAAAQLLGATGDETARVEEAIHAAETAAHGNDATAALASGGRAYLLAENLVRATRGAHPAPAGATDGGELLGQLSESGGLEPRRDERGVIATMRSLFVRGATLAPTAHGRIETMARVVQNHADAHVRIEAYVGGADRARAERDALAEAQAVAAALVQAGVPAARLQSAGVYRVNGGSRTADAVEIVLVLPREP